VAFAGCSWRAVLAWGGIVLGSAMLTSAFTSKWWLSWIR
jgi:hypothetical protein